MSVTSGTVLLNRPQRSLKAGLCQLLPAVLIAALLIGLCESAGAPPRPAEGSRADVRYEERLLDGFKVMVDRRLVADKDDAAALDCLHDHLVRSVRALPEGYRTPVRTIVIWIMRDAPVSVFNITGEGQVGAYNPLGLARSTDGEIARKAGGIELYARSFLLRRGAAIGRERAPFALLHEFAHAVHDRIFDNKNAGIIAAYDRAVAQRMYDKVETRQFGNDGRCTIRFGPAFALTNHLEYFAELSEAYLGENKLYFPFRRTDIQNQDEAGYALMQAVWEDFPYVVVNGSSDRVKVMGTGLNPDWRCPFFELAPAERREFMAWPGLRLLVSDPRGGLEDRMTPRPGQVCPVRKPSASDLIRRPPD